MVNSVDIADFLNLSHQSPILDVRSPAEYYQGRICASLSFPLFDNEERQIIGTLYKKDGKKVAVKKGLEIVGPKMRSFLDKAEALKSDQLRLYCWRGGMRSESMSWLLETYGFQTLVLRGGYKSYRRAMFSFFDQELPLRIIAGYTGSMKTELLNKIRKLGGQVIDLEGLANHQGSSFGNQKSSSQPTTEHFQNLIFEAFRFMDLSQPIFIEDECMRIGRVNLIESLYSQMCRSPHILIEVDKIDRVQFLVEDYGMLTSEQLIRATKSIRNKLGHDMAKKAISLIETGDLAEAVGIILTYYDKRYELSLERKNLTRVSRYKTCQNNLNELARQLVKHAI